MSKYFFETPKQVHFCADGEWCYGIAFEDKIICACCGCVFETEDVTDIMELPWINFTEEIIMDYNLPFGEIEEEEE